MSSDASEFIAFACGKRIAQGSLAEVAVAAREASGGDPAAVVVLEVASAAPVDLDLRGSEAEILARLPIPAPAATAEDELNQAPRGRGRPRLGVVSREVSLLPRHWEWLREQPGGASAALRRLVEEARRKGGARDRLRRAQAAVDRFMQALGGDLPNYEEASRAFYQGRDEDMQKLLQKWPADLRHHLMWLVQRCRTQAST